MQHIQQLFLEALKAALKNEQVEWNNKLEAQEWMDLFRMAEVHQILPMIYEAVYRCPAAQMADPQILAPAKKQMVRAVIMQTQKTGEFEPLYRYLQSEGICPLVVKGIICRNIYPNPDYRISGDEDLLIRPEDFKRCHELLLSYGMQTSECDMSEEELERIYEVPYGKKGSLIYIELHKSLFPPESDAYGDLNRFFENVYTDAIEIRIDKTDIRTMGYTDHLFYLICHAFKHFLHSGFGIRQVCDIILFANAYGDAIDWERVLKQCREIQADLFAAALFGIGEKYLTFDPERAHYTESWRKIQVDETDMLMDLLDSGIYGNANMSRKHSSNMTLDAVAADKSGKKAGNTVLKSLFPSAKKLESRYPYLRKYPVLLPIAWADRILKYRKETAAGGGNAAADSVKIGNQRIELMKKYGIIKK